MRIGEICTRSVVTCERGETALEIAQRMRERHVGDVVVVDSADGGCTPVGIVTDRDLAIQVLAPEVDPRSICAGDLIAGELITALDSDLVYDAIWTMRRKAVRRLPVVDSRRQLVGVLTADDVTEFLAEELTEIARIVPRQMQHEEAVRAPLTRP
ncbi:MAG TPA: CBS domain-containing protein [Ideonella sp.]|nr:CBS domain-containing protein [Ideonella sp.]